MATRWTLLMLAVLFWTPTTAEGAPVNGQIQVSVWAGGAWAPAGSLGFHRHLDLRSITLDGAEAARIKLTHRGRTGAHLDAVTLGGVAPLAVTGGAADKLARQDYDLLDLSRGSIDLTFPPGAGGELAVVARVEPRNIGKTPFHFPRANLFREVTADSTFYAYHLGSRAGVLNLDGELSDEPLGEPLFSEFCDSASGHPSATTHGWVRDDGQHLYVALDFTPDNTMDGEKDYARLYVNTANGVRTFQVSVPEQRWGRPGFANTNRAAYQHKVYELKVPLGELGLVDTSPGTRIELAFAAYGTAAPDKGPPDLAIPDQSIPDQEVPDQLVPDQKLADKAAADKASTSDLPTAMADAAPPVTGGDDEGCDCNVSGPDGSGFMGLLLIAVLLGLRRRQ